MDIDDLDGTVTTVNAVLRPSGWFNISLLHPCIPGEATPAGEALPSWPPHWGTARGWWTTESTGVRGSSVRQISPTRP